jgi:prevent-host-death family protein
MDVSVRELKDHLSEYLRRAEAGEEIVITSRGRAIARLAPAQAAVSAEPLTEEELIARFRQLPWVRPGNGEKPQGASNPIRIGPGEKTLAEIVSEQRR